MMRKVEEASVRRTNLGPTRSEIQKGTRDNSMFGKGRVRSSRIRDDDG
jgi:hypothetical protein